MPTPAELAENTGAYVLPRPHYETVVTDDYTYAAGPNNAWVLQIRTPNIEEERARRSLEVERFVEDDVAHHWAAYDDGRPVGFGRAVDMDGGVALMGGAVLPDARGRGVYRALVHARWEHAVARDTPLLVVQ